MLERGKAVEARRVAQRVARDGEAAEAAETAQAAETANGSALKSTRTPKAQRFRKRSRNAVVGALAAAAAFVLANDMLDQDEGQED